MYSKTVNKLTVIDYFSFGFLLLLSALVGVYYAIFDRKSQSTTRGYFLADRSLHPIPVALSLMASFISSTLMLAGPGEIYVQNTMQFYYEIFIIPACLLASITFIPLLIKIQARSVYQVLKFICVSERFFNFFNGQ